MPGFMIQVGATVMCAHGGQAQATVPSAARPARRPAGRDPAGTVGRRRLRLRAAGRQRAVRDGELDRGRRSRVLAGGQPVLLQDSQAICVPTGTPLTVVVTAGPGQGDADMNVDFPFRIDGRGRSAAGRRRRARPRPHRAGAVHVAGRAGQPADVRQRAAPARLRAEQRRARDRDPVPRPGRPAAVAGRGHRGRRRRRRESRLHARGHRATTGASPQVSPRPPPSAREV